MILLSVVLKLRFKKVCVDSEQCEETLAALHWGKGP